MENIKEQESLEAEVKEETKSVTTDDKKKSSGKKKTFIGIGVAAVAIIAVVLLLIVIISIVAVIAFHKPTVNMNDYITINASGYNGYGKASYDFDSEKFIEENGKKFKISKRIKEATDDNPLVEIGLSLYGIDVDDKNDGAKLFFASTGLDGKLSETNGLSNGDTVVFSWDSSYMTDEEIAAVAKEMRVKVKYSDIEYTVENLREVPTFDSFDGVEVAFSGMEPNGKVVIANYPDNGLNYYIDGETEGLKNGDEVIIKIEYPYGVEEYINNYQKKAENETKSYTVEGLGKYLTSSSQIPEEYLEEMKAQANDVILGTTNGWVEGYSLDINYIGNYFLSAKENTSDIQNGIVLVYKMHYENTFNDYKTGEQDVYHDYYYFVMWENIYEDGQGKFNYSQNEYIKTTDKHTCEFDIYHDIYAWIADSKYKLSFVGYDSLESLYDVIILKNIEYYKYEDNIVE
jgi:hypothetical protein